MKKIREEVMECTMLVLSEVFDFITLEQDVLSNVCEEQNLDVSDIFPYIQLMQSKRILINYLFNEKARNEKEQMILNEVKNQIIEYIQENGKDFEDDVITMFNEYASGGNARKFLLENNIIEMIKEL